MKSNIFLNLLIFFLSLFQEITVAEVMEAILDRLSIEDSKKFKYYMTIKKNQNSIEKTLLCSNSMYNYLKVRKRVGERLKLMHIATVIITNFII